MFKNRHNIVVTSLKEEGAGVRVSRAFDCLFCTCLFLSFCSSSWCWALAAACDCGTPWTFLLALFLRTEVLKQFKTLTVTFILDLLHVYEEIK